MKDNTKLSSINCYIKKISFYFLFCIVVQPINNVMIVSGRQQRGSVIHVCIFPQIPLPSRLPHNIEQSFPVLFSRILLVIHFKYSSIYMLVPGSLTQFHFLKSIIFSPIVYESTLFSIPSLKMFCFFSSVEFVTVLLLLFMFWFWARRQVGSQLPKQRWNPQPLHWKSHHWTIREVPQSVY